MRSFDQFLALLSEVPDPRRAEGKLYKLPYVLLFSILAVVTGGNSFRSIETFIKVHRRRLNAAFGLRWQRAPAHTAIRYILQGLDPQAVEQVFRRHAAGLCDAATDPARRSIALDGKALRRSFDNFNDRKAAQLLRAFDVEMRGQTRNREEDCLHIKANTVTAPAACIMRMEYIAPGCPKAGMNTAPAEIPMSAVPTCGR